MSQYWCCLQLHNKLPPNVTTSNKNSLLSLMVLCVDQFPLSGSDLGSLMQLRSDGSWDWSHLKTRLGWKSEMAHSHGWQLMPMDQSVGALVLWGSVEAVPDTWPFPVV